MNKIKKILPIILAFVLVFGSCLTVCAVETDILSECINVVENNNKVIKSHNFVYKCDDTHYMLVTSVDKGVIYTGASAQYYSKTGYIYYKISSDYQYIEEILGSSGGINYLPIYTAGSEYHASSESINSRLIQSSYDLLDSDGNVFFLGPVSPVELALEELPETMNNQVAVILTIAIACLALLITLSVLRKKLPIFLH